LKDLEEDVRERPAGFEATVQREALLPRRAPGKNTVMNRFRWCRPRALPPSNIPASLQDAQDLGWRLMDDPAGVEELSRWSVRLCERHHRKGFCEDAASSG
jgi:hypothetical protein